MGRPSLVALRSAAEIGDTFNQYASSAALRERLSDYLARRAGAQILLVGEAAGYRGARVGGASVSRKHANFIGTEPGATAADVEALIRMIQDRIEADTGTRLEPEVRVIGPADD